MDAPSPALRTLSQPLVPTLSAWTVERAKQALAEHEEGQFYNSAVLGDHLTRNPAVIRAMNTRTLAVLGLPFALEPGEGDGRKNGAAVAALKPRYGKILTPAGARQMLDGMHTVGVAFAKLSWHAEGGRWWPRATPWHASAFRWDDATQGYIAQTLEGDVPVTRGDGQWLVLEAVELRAWSRGIVRCLGLENSIRELAVRDWARFSEVHGLATVIAKVPSDAQPADARRFVSDIAARGGESVVLTKVDRTGEGFGVELLEAKDAAWEGFQALIAQCDNDVAIALLGAAPEPTQGVYVPKANSSGVRLDYLEADAVVLDTAMHRDVIEPWAEFNFGNRASAPRPCHDATPPEDREKTVGTYKTLGEAVTALNGAATASGSKQVIDFDTLAERHGLPLKAAPPKPPAPAPSATGEPAPKPGAPKPPATAAALSAGAQDAATGLLAGQAYIDTVAEHTLSKAGDDFAPTLAIVFAELHASTDYPDLLARLTRAFPAMATASDGRFRALLHDSARMALSAGVWSAHPDAVT